MCEKTKQEVENEDEITPEIIKEQTEHDYYYDDSCGYEVYIDDEDDSSRVSSRIDDSK